MASVERWWSALNPTAKRTLAVGSIGTVLIVSIVALASVSPEVAKRPHGLLANTIKYNAAYSTDIGCRLAFQSGLWNALC